MILNKKIKIKMFSKTFKHYKECGYKFNYGDEIIIDVNHLPKNSAVKILVGCDECGAEKYITYQKYNQNISKYNTYTCIKCKSNKCKKTKLEKYDDENYNNSEKTKETCLEKYGVDNVSKLNEIKLKKENTTFKNYQVLNPMQSDIIKLKFKNTMNERFDGILMQSEQLKKKIIDTNLKKYGFENPFSFLEIKDKLKIDRTEKILKSYENSNLISLVNNIYTFKCDCEKNHNFDIVANILYNRNRSKTIICTICNPIGSFSSSGYETQLYEFIKNNYNNEIITNSKNIIPPLELDIYLPELKLAFEFNGIYWHNELYKDKNYHLNKTEECEKQGIQLIHVWEDDWIYKQEIIKSLILDKLDKININIDIVNCEIKEISDNKLVKTFLNNNHIQGYVSAKFKIGLFYNNELVSIIVFRNKTSINTEYELLRFCNKLNTTITDSEYILFKYFINNYNPTEIITYIDRSNNNCELYKKLTFNFVDNTKPNYYYVVNNIRKNKYFFSKDKLINEGYDENKTEHEIMLDRKIFRIYDSGKIKLKFNK